MEFSEACLKLSIFSLTAITNPFFSKLTSRKYNKCLHQNRLADLSYTFSCPHTTKAPATFK